MLCTAVVFWLAGRHSRTPFATVLIGQPTLRRMIKLGVLAALDQRSSPPPRSS
jgi:type II secretory pathway predicted ATPase ExeA